jgi:predicted membrane protein
MSLLVFCVCIALYLFVEDRYMFSQNAYYLYHILYGFGFTFFFFAAFDSFKAASIFTIICGLTNEFYIDLKDRLESEVIYIQWDHVASDLIGWSLAYCVWVMLKKYHPKLIEQSA